MYHGSEEELRAAEMAGRVYDNLCTNTPLELHGIRQLHIGHIGGASLDAENDTVCSSHNTSAVREQSQTHSRRGAGGTCYFSGANVNSVVEIARRESVLRQLYNDKLRGSINAIISAIVNEVPRDHIFLQLLSDSATEQYCRVRVGEVVESFLFSVQAHQYHNLAAELAKREVEVLTLSKTLEELEEKLTELPQPIKTSKTTQTNSSIETGMNIEDEAEKTQRQKQTKKNCVEDEEMAIAHGELFALLEEVTREHELAKCRECLSAPMSLLETVQAEGNYRNKYEYLSDVVAHLFRSVHGLVLYAEGSLNSLDSLRHGLRGTFGGNELNCKSVHKEVGVPDTMEHTPLKAPLSNAATIARNVSTLQHVSSSSTTETQEQTPRLFLFEEERSRLEKLAAQLKYAQQHFVNVIESLGKTQTEIQRQCDTLQHQVSQQQQLATKNINSTEFSKALKANETALLLLRNEFLQSFSAERSKAEERERQFEQRYLKQTTELSQATEALAVVRQELQLEKERRIKAEQRVCEAEIDVEQTRQKSNAAVCDLQRSHEAEKNTIQAKLQELQLDLVARRSQIVVTRLEEIALDACVAKMTLLAEHGYERVVAEQHYALLLSNEFLRHTQSQLAAAKSALREREETSRQCYEDLRSLLECMREDECNIEKRRSEEETETELRRRQTLSVLLNDTTSIEASDKKKKNDNDDDNSSHYCGDFNKDWYDDGGGGGRVQSHVQTLHRRYGIPTTLTGIVTGLQNAYEMTQRSQQYVQSTADAAKESVRWLEKENAALRLKLEQLTAECEEQRKSFKQMWDERAMWERQETLRGLLAKQESALAEVNLEREELQRRWTVLSEDYQTLERRNSQLHERCAAKEVENARLMGCLRAKHMTEPPSSPSSLLSFDTLHREQKSSSHLPSVVSPLRAVTTDGALNANGAAVLSLPNPPCREQPSQEILSSVSTRTQTSIDVMIDDASLNNGNNVLGGVFLQGQLQVVGGAQRTTTRLGQCLDAVLNVKEVTEKNDITDLS